MTNLKNLYNEYNLDGNIGDAADVIVVIRTITSDDVVSAVNYAMELDTLVREDIISAMQKDGYVDITNGVVTLKG